MRCSWRFQTNFLPESISSLNLNFMKMCVSRHDKVDLIHHFIAKQSHMACKDQWIVVVWLIISNLNSMLCYSNCYIFIVKRRFKGIIFLLCAFSHDLWRNILHTCEGIGTVLLLLVFCRIYYKICFIIQLFYVYITLALWQTLYPIGWLALYGLTECIINEWMNECQYYLTNRLYRLWFRRLFLYQKIPTLGWSLLT